MLKVGCNFIWVVWVSLAIFVAAPLVGCNKVSDSVKLECNGIDRWLDLTDKEKNICLQSKEDRKRWKRETRVRFGKALARGFNSRINLLVPDPKYASRAKKVSDIGYFPVFYNDVKVVSKYTEKIFKLDSVVAWKDVEPGYGSNVDVIDPDAEIASDLPLWRKVETDFLNAYQKKFIENHCSLNDLKPYTSLCRGEVFLTVSRGPNSLFPDLQILGANFKKVDEAKVINALIDN